MSDALNTARTLVAAALEIDPAQVADDANLDNLEAWDSLAHLRVVQGLEEKLGHILPAEDIVGIYGLVDVAAILDRAEAA
jgi:acyl carrier protein